ncbi:MAG: glycerophosphodiester phosphodiesterase family protein [Pseudomonadota bacterium]
MKGPELPPAFLTRALAHRALHGPGIPENSRAAVERAIEAGYGIEIDLQLSSDNIPMVFHDDGLARLTEESGPVAARPASELSRISLRGGDEGIPTFAEILSLVAGQVPLLVEIKDQTGDMSASDGVLEAAAAEGVSGYEGPLAFMSFNPSCVRALARAAPDRPRGLVTCAYRAEDWPDLSDTQRETLSRVETSAVGASFISHEWTDLGSPRVAAARSAGCAVLCWTIRSAAAEAEARRIAQNVTFEGYLPTPVA